MDLEALVRKGEVAWLDPADALEGAPGAGPAAGADFGACYTAPTAPAADAGAGRKRKEAPGSGHGRDRGRHARSPAPGHPARRGPPAQALQPSWAAPEQVVDLTLGAGSEHELQPAHEQQHYRPDVNGRGAAWARTRGSNGGWDSGEGYRKVMSPGGGLVRAGQQGAMHALGGGGRAARDPAVECDPTLDPLGGSLGGFGGLPGMPAVAQFPEVPTDAALLSLLGPDFAWT